MKTVKLVKENIGENLFNVGLDKKFCRYKNKCTIHRRKSL